MNVLVVVLLVVLLVCGAVAAFALFTAAAPRSAGQASAASPVAEQPLTPAPDSGDALGDALTTPDLHILDKAREVAAAPVYADCAAVQAAGRAPIVAGQPGFVAEFDPDGDGIGCDS